MGRFHKKTAPVQVSNAPPFPIKIHSKSFPHSRAVGTVDGVTDNVGILVKTNALHMLIIHRVDYIWPHCKAVARLVVAADTANFFRGVQRKYSILKPVSTLRTLQI